jgi:probable phosphoglycerate mutase
VERDRGTFGGMAVPTESELKTERALPAGGTMTDRSRSPQQITERSDALIKDIRERFHAHAIGKPKGSVDKPFDVLIVAHGHILRAFAGRWYVRGRQWFEKVVG